MRSIKIPPIGNRSPYLLYVQIIPGRDAVKLVRKIFRFFKTRLRFIIKTTSCALHTFSVLENSVVHDPKPPTRDRFDNDASNISFFKFNSANQFSLLQKKVTLLCVHWTLILDPLSPQRRRCASVKAVENNSCFIGMKRPFFKAFSFYLCSNEHKISCNQYNLKVF
jgi:hypothetical protein